MSEIFLIPLLHGLNLYTPNDPTFGRYLQPISPYELELEKDPYVKVRMRRVFINSGRPEEIDCGEDVQLTEREVETGAGKEWIFYKVWECESGKGGIGDGCDLVMLHGTSPLLGCSFFRRSPLTESLSVCRAGLLWRYVITSSLPSRQ